MGFSVIRIIEAVGFVLQSLIIIRLLIDIVVSYSETRISRNNITGFFYDLTEPFFKPFRKVLPPSVIIDTSPIFALAVIEIVTKIVIGILYLFQIT